MNNNLRNLFSKRYSFISSPTAYGPLRQYRVLKNRYYTAKEAFKLKLPMNMRIFKVTNAEKSMFTMLILFWASVEYLGSLILM